SSPKVPTARHRQVRLYSRAYVFRSLQLTTVTTMLRSLLHRLLQLSLRDTVFNYRWKKTAKLLVPRAIQLEIRRRVLTASLRYDTARVEFDAGGVRLLVKPGDFVIDVGANVGAYTSLLSSLVGSNGRVWAFEPLPENHEVLTFASKQLA